MTDEAICDFNNAIHPIESMTTCFAKVSMFQDVVQGSADDGRHVHAFSLHPNDVHDTKINVDPASLRGARHRA